MITTDEYNKLSKINKIAKITLDFYNDSYNWVPSKQSDNARYLEVTLTENGVFRPVSDDEVARIRILKPDNTIIFNDCETIEGGKVLVELTENILAYQGKAQFDILLTNTSAEENSDYLYSTKIGFMNITSTPYPNEKIESTDEFKSLTTILIEEGQRIEDLKELDALLKANEATRQDNEAKRVEAENKRQEDTAEAIANAETATQNANTATTNANDAANTANTAASNADQATQAANTATQNANQATEDAVEATNDAIEATNNANTVINTMNQLIADFHIVIVSDTQPSTLKENDEWLELID